MQVEQHLKDKFNLLLEKRKGTLEDLLGIEYLVVRKDEVRATMPVERRSKQPFGLLHGGASLALAETLASVGGWLNVDENRFTVSGMEINANHLRPATGGLVTATAKPLHIGRKTQVWEVKILNDEHKPVCVSRCTLYAAEKR